MPSAAVVVARSDIIYINNLLCGRLFALATDLQLSGLGYAPEMVKAAREINQEHIQSGASDLELGASDAMPFADATFDTVFCINVLYFWDKPADHLLEVRRVLKPRGRFFVIIITKETLEMIPFSRFGFHVYEAGASKRFSPRSHHIAPKLIRNARKSFARTST